MSCKISLVSLKAALPSDEDPATGYWKLAPYEVASSGISLGQGFLSEIFWESVRWGEGEAVVKPLTLCTIYTITNYEDLRFGMRCKR